MKINLKILILPIVFGLSVINASDRRSESGGSIGSETPRRMRVVQDDKAPSPIDVNPFIKNTIEARELANIALNLVIHAKKAADNRDGKLIIELAQNVQALAERVVGLGCSERVYRSTRNAIELAKAANKPVQNALVIVTFADAADAIEDAANAIDSVVRCDLEYHAKIVYGYSPKKSWKQLLFGQ